ARGRARARTAQCADSPVAGRRCRSRRRRWRRRAMTPEPETIEIGRYLAPLRRHLSSIVTFCGSATVACLLFTYVVSEKYLATATVLYQPREAVSFRPKVRDALGFPMPLVALESIGNTLDQVLKSDGVLERTVRTLHLDVKTPQPAANPVVALYRRAKDGVMELRQDVWEILKYGRLMPRDPVQKAIQQLRRTLTVKRTSKAYTFDIEALDQDPRRAAAIV